MPRLTTEARQRAQEICENIQLQLEERAREIATEKGAEAITAEHVDLAYDQLAKELG